MSNINLLPDSYRLRPANVRMAQILKKVSILLFVILFISIATSMGLFFMYGGRIDEATGRKSSLERQIKALEQTEQRLILVQDRLRKTDQIGKISSSNEEIDGIKILIEEFGSGIRLKEASLGENDLKISLVSTGSTEILEFIDFIEKENEFQKVVLNSMTFSGGSGFATELTLVKK